MTVSSQMLLWIAVGVLLAIVAYLAWRLWVASRPSLPPASAEPKQLPPSPPVTTRPAATERRGAPPPAWAGTSAAEGAAAAARNASPARPASAGAGRTASNAPGSHAPPRPRTSKPPPVLAGNVPGYTPSLTTPTARPRSARPPAAAAGGGGDGGKASSDPEPAPAVSPAPKRSLATARPAAALAAVQSWGYQLQNVDDAAASAAPFDLLVIDYARDGRDETALTRADLARLKQRDGRPPRLVYAYVSIGEAESYRFYWQDAWTQTPPGWLLSENPDWRENFAVAYWEPDWQRILFGGADAYIDRILAAGFDGIYLDKCDVHEDLERREKRVAKARGDLEGDMVRFLTGLSAYVRRTYPGIGLIMQNAEHLLEHADVRAAIDAVAKEELLYGQAGGTRRNAKGEIADAKAALDRVRRDGKAVFVVEYLDDPARAADAAREVRDLGFVPYVARQDRELATLESGEPEVV